MTRHLTRIGVILLASTALGVGAAQMRQLPWAPDLRRIEGQEKARTRSEEIRRTHGINLEEFKQLIAGGAIVIDARPAAEFEKGHLQVLSYPPVLNVDAPRAAEQMDRLMQLQGQPTVLYCTSLDCHLAEELLIELETLGLDISTMKVYPEGWEGILKAGLPTATGPDTWTGYDELIEQTDPAAGDQVEENPDENPVEDDGGMETGDDGSGGGGR